MEIERLYNKITAITNSKNKQREKERRVIDAVAEYSRENKIKFEETLDKLDEFVNVNNLKKEIDE